MIAICFFARLILFVMMMMMIWKLEVWSKCPSEGVREFGSPNPGGVEFPSCSSRLFPQLAVCARSARRVLLVVAGDAI